MILELITQTTAKILMVTTAASVLPVQPPSTPMIVEEAAQEIRVAQMPKPLPQSPERAWEITIPITAYSSTPDQTDDSPFITANNTVVRDGIVAANFLPLGTRIQIPELFDDKEFLVADRMNKRYYYKVDIWMPSREKAKKFGLQYHTIKVLPPANAFTP